MSSNVLSHPREILLIHFSLHTCAQRMSKTPVMQHINPWPDNLNVGKFLILSLVIIILIMIRIFISSKALFQQNVARSAV